MDYSWNWITTRIALGGQFESVSDLSELTKVGITDVINCREVPDPAYVTDKVSVCWPQPYKPDDGTQRTQEWFVAGGNYWKFLFFQPERKVYVHCHAGMNRSASMVYFLLRLYGLYPDDAKSLIHKHRWLTDGGVLTPELGIRYAEEAEMYVR